MIKSIFVIGRDRSGTKWLSNIIAGHKEIACVQHEDHFGILEASDILSYAPVVFGDLHVPENLIAFIECFSQTDFFRLTGLDKNHFYKLRPADYIDFFREMMDLFAENEGKKYWVQKSGVSSMNDLSKHFPDGKFIVIVRNIKDNIRSKIGQWKLHLGGDQRKPLLKESVKYFIDMEQIKKYAELNNVYVVQYEDLRKDKKNVMKNVCEFVGIGFDEEILEDKFRKNTSFRSGVSKEEILTKYDFMKLDILSALLRFVPGFIYEYLYEKRLQEFRKEHTYFEQKKFISFKLKKKETGLE